MTYLEKFDKDLEQVIFGHKIKGLCWVNKSNVAVYALYISSLAVKEKGSYQL